MITTAQIFGLVLTACGINAQGEVTDCEDHILDVSYRESVCYNQLEKEVPNLLELESLKCIVLVISKHNLLSMLSTVFQILARPLFHWG